MSGGSSEKESPHDKKCPDCGLWYQDKGVSFTMHASSCGGSKTSDSGSDSTSEKSGQGQSKNGGIGVPSSTGSDESKSSVGNCPDCGSSLDEIASGRVVTGSFDGETVRVETESGDGWCGDCELLSSSTGEVVR